MAWFAKQRAEIAGRKAYMNHVSGNKLYDAGKADEARAKHRAALEQYESAISKGCERAAYIMAYGVLLLRFDQFEKARDVFLKAEKIPGLSKVEKRQLRINFAICQWKLGNLDRAIEQLQIARQDGANSMIYGSLGFMLIEKGERGGDYTEAIAFNREAYKYDEDDAVVLDNMGQLHLRMGEREKALEYFKRAHEIKPRQVDTLYYLAYLAIESGDSESAREYLDTALSGNFSALSTIKREEAQALRDGLT
jgi:tetratricopeptide (TPR) repeat protein